MGFSQAVGKTLRRLVQLSETLLRRMLPDESMLTLPRSTMAFIAVAVPLVVVTVAAVVYFQRGRGRFYEAYLERAQQAVVQAREFEHEGEKRIAWNAALENIEFAEIYRVTAETQTIRLQAREALDTMDNVHRAAFQPALIDALPETAVITRIVTTPENELYLLEGDSGQVYRAVSAGEGYKLDEVFYCGPVPDPLVVGPLVDIQLLPEEHPTAAELLGMDGNGNLMQCIPENDKPIFFSMPPPDMNWGTPQAFTLEDQKLYIMDTLTNAVWIYDLGSEDRKLPNFFFGDQVPTMQDVLDLTVIDGKLYLLHADGQLTTSYEGGEKYTDGVLYKDSREGFEDSATFAGAAFSEIQYVSIPDPTFYFLDSANQAIYQST